MITNSNPSQMNFDSPDIVVVDSKPADKDFGSADVIADLQRRKENIANGGINCLPLSFKRFSDAWPGLEHEQYIVFTANTKVGKTQIASFLCLYETLNYAFEHPDQCSVDVLYFPLEESIQRIYQRYMSYLLYKFDGYRLSPRDLRSTSVDYPLPDDALALLKSDRYQERLRFFDKHVCFNQTDTNPTGIHNACKAFAKRFGEYRTRKVKSANGSGREVEEFVSYTPYDPNHYQIIFVDHVRLIDSEKGFTQKQTIDKFSEYVVKYMRERYKQTVISIQQQTFETEGLEAIKMKRMVPSLAGLGDSKYTSQDANIIVGLFDPNQFGLPNWNGYTIDDGEGHGLMGYSRFMNLIRGRDGEAGDVCPLYFDGAVCYFEELPKPEDVNAITQYYTRVKNLRSYRQQRKATTLSGLVLTIFKRIIYNGNKKMSQMRTRTACE